MRKPRGLERKRWRSPTHHRGAKIPRFKRGRTALSESALSEFGQKIHLGLFDEALFL